MICVCAHSVMSDSVTPWTVAHQTFLSMEFSRQEHWSGLPFLALGDLSNSEIEPKSPALQAESLPSEPPGKLCLLHLLHWQVILFTTVPPGKPYAMLHIIIYIYMIAFI